MDVAVLQPQDCLRNPPSRKPLVSPPPKMKLTNPNPKHSSSRTTRNNPNRQKRTQNGLSQTRPASDAEPKVHKLVMGQVKILKRGEQLAETTPDRKTETVKEAFRSTEQLSTERVVGLYAGSSMCVASPPPSSVPVPLFLTKKIAAVADATNDLRKMLRLEFS